MSPCAALPLPPAIGERSPYPPGVGPPRPPAAHVEALVLRDVSSKLPELLNLIGSTRETVSLTLSTFKRKRLIQTEGSKVIISDAEALRALYEPPWRTLQLDELDASQRRSRDTQGDDTSQNTDDPTAFRD